MNRERWAECTQSEQRKPAPCFLSLSSAADASAPGAGSISLPMLTPVLVVTRSACTAGSQAASGSDAAPLDLLLRFGTLPARPCQRGSDPGASPAGTPRPRARTAGWAEAPPLRTATAAGEDNGTAGQPLQPAGLHGRHSPPVRRASKELPNPGQEVNRGVWESQRSSKWCIPEKNVKQRWPSRGPAAGPGTTFSATTHVPYGGL